MTSDKWHNRYEDAPPALTRRQPSDAALAAASRTIYCIPARNVVGIWAYEFTTTEGKASAVAADLIDALARQFDEFAAQVMAAQERDEEA